MKLDNKGMTGQAEAGMVIGLIMVAIVLGTMITNLDTAITLTGQGNTSINESISKLIDQNQQKTQGTGFWGLFKRK